MRFLNTTPENAKIRENLGEGLLPILPIEAALLQEQRQWLIARQQELARELNDAMSQTSETWHDNAPADAINLEGSRNSMSGEKIGNAIRHALVYEYPTQIDEVTLGSLIRATMPNGKSKSLFLAGYMQEVKNYTRNDVGIFTLKSPLGEAILGALPQDTIEYRVGERTLSLAINSIELPRSAFGDDTKLPSLQPQE